MPLLAIDIGGTTIKYTLYDKGKLGDITSVKTTDRFSNLFIIA